MDELIFHPTTSKQLLLAVKKAKHAYLFAGPEGLGKTTAALKFAANLLGEQIDAGDLSRWVYILKPEEGKKISVAQVKEMAKFANQSKALSVEKKVVIIDQADNIGIEAANSLLSMLEEAPANTVFILVSNNSESLPNTVLSRLQTIRFYEPNKQQLETFLQANNIDSKYIDLVGNQPAKLLNTELLEDQLLLAKKADRFAESNLAGRLSVVAELSDKIQVEDFMKNLARKMIINKDEFSAHRGESLLLAQSHLYNNGNPRFVLECLALEFE